MNSAVFWKPSFYAHVATGLIALIFLILFFFNYHKIKSFYEKMVLLLLFGLLVGIHGISHRNLEMDDHFNPLLILRNPLS